MKVILFMAMSLNGVIARENNEEDFLSHDNWVEWLKWIRKSGCVVWGRKTYEIVKTWDKQYFEDIKGVKAVVVSSNKNYKVGEGFELVSSPKEALEKLEKEGYKTAIVTGGSTLNSYFVKEKLIDEIVINVEPVVVGKGIALFNPDDFDLNLNLLETKKLGHGIIQVRYKIKK